MRYEMAVRRLETGDWRWEMGDGRWEMGDGRNRHLADVLQLG
jgi:hypothetical protein